MSNPPFVATPTTWVFMQDDAFVRVLLGPIGSSKSVTCLHEIMKRALQQAPNAEGIRKTRWAIVRNTVDQLKSTVLKSLADWFGHWFLWRASEKTYYMDHCLPDGTRVHCEIMAISMDEPDSVRKALSLELTGAFINEAREIAPEVIDGLLMRLRRYPSKKDGGPTWSGAILDSNPPDDGSWFHDKLENPPENWRVFIQPPAILNRQEWLAKFGEDPPEEEGVKDAQDETWWVNPDADNLANLDAEYYRALIPGKTADFRDVYLRNRYGRSLSGLPVYDRTFNAEYHVAKSRFTPLKSADHPVIVGLDFGRCYDNQTEVLTREGWKLFAEVDEATDMAATLDPVTRELSYTPINFKVALPYTGEMLCWAGTNIDLCVTPAHRFPYTNRETPDVVRWASAEELSGKLTSHKYAVVAPRSWVGTPPIGLPHSLDPLVYAEFLGWWMADGNVENGTNRVVVTQKKPASDLQAVMQLVADAAGVSVRSKNGFAFSDAVLANHLRAFGPKHGGQRRVPDAIRFAPPEVILAFIAAYTRGDGHIRPPRRGTAHEEHTIWFESRELAGQFQDLAQKVGWGSALRWQCGGTSTLVDGRAVTCQGGWVTSFKKKWERVELLPGQFSRVPYSGTVYCLNVPHHTLCVRRNGKVSWNGNTPAATLLQRNAFGQLIVLDELTSENMGVERFLSIKLTPLLTRADYLGTHIVIAPDPAGFSKQQVGEVSPADVVRRAGYKVVRPHTNNPELRIQAVERVLTRNIDGKPAFQVNPECKELIRAFKGGYRYAFDRKGNQADRPDKNWASHISDSCQYGCLIAEGGHGGNPLLANKRREVTAVSSTGWT